MIRNRRPQHRPQDLNNSLQKRQMGFVDPEGTLMKSPVVVGWGLSVPENSFRRTNRMERLRQMT
jgi:hypothetical protein